MNTLYNRNPNIREPGGELLMRSSGASTHYYHYDELGSTRLLTNSSGAVTDTYTYDAYGSLITHNRSTGSVDQPYQYVGRLGYYTHHQSPDFRWLQLGVRFYQPDEGRFERRDEFQYIDESPYSYVNNQVTIFTDPSGKDRWPFGNGIVCVDSSCHGKSYFPSGIKNIPDFANGSSSRTQRLPNPPKPCKGKTRQNCAESDVIYVPETTDVDAKPKRQSNKHNYLRVRDGHECTISCDDKAKVKIKIRCKSVKFGAGLWKDFWQPLESL